MNIFALEESFSSHRLASVRREIPLHDYTMLYLNQRAKTAFSSFFAFLPDEIAMNHATGSSINYLGETRLFQPTVLYWH